MNNICTCVTLQYYTGKMSWTTKLPDFGVACSLPLRCTRCEVQWLLLAERKDEAGCTAFTQLVLLLFQRIQSEGGQQKADWPQQLTTGGELQSEKLDLPICSRSLHLSRHSQIFFFLLCKGHLFSIALSCIPALQGLLSTDSHHLHLSWPLSSFCHLHKPRLPKEHQDEKVTSQGSCGNLDKHHVKAAS